jgi:hypothetical protein
MKPNLKLIFEAFQTDAPFYKGSPFGSGHIHETYYIETAGKSSTNYILQKLNNNVFKDLESLQKNIERVTSHIRSKLSEQGVTDINRRTLTPVLSKNGTTSYKDRSGDTWRIFIFIEDHHSYDIVDSPEKAYQGGKAIGRFQALLSDLPEPPLFDTIPFFHDIEKRLETFHKTVHNDPEGRVNSLSNEIKFIRDREDRMKTIHRLGIEGKIPVRITHNDTKFNNILFDSEGVALCVIDLDTVMPGYVHYDFGDAIRTAASSAAEDETDLDRVYMDISLFKEFTRGYLEELNETLNIVEKQHLAFAPQLITYTIGLRFLTDHIDGDNYFRIHHQNHNLERARAQFRLVESNEEQYDKMVKIVTDLS